MDLDDSNPQFWILVHPRGDRTEITPVEMCRATAYEKSDYALASEREFETLELASNYGRALVLRWGRVYVADDDEIIDRLEKSRTEERADAEKFLGDIRGSAMGQLEFNNLVMEWGLRALSDEAVVELARRWREHQERYG